MKYQKEEVCPFCGAVRLVSKYKKKPTRCRKCVNVGRKHTEETNKKNSERNRGSNNGFYGKKHTEEVRSKLGKYVRTDEQKEKIRQLLKPYSNTRSFYDIWVEKYGKDIADLKMAEFKVKQSILNSGKNNAMFGKPSPQGSGNGWSGWYCGYFFRSILELSYLRCLVDSNVSFENGELKKHSITYIKDGLIRNYFPDYYLLDSSTYIEIKPLRLLKTSLNIIKFNAAKEKHGDRFIILTELDIDVLSSNDITILYNTGEIVWTDRYNKKYHELNKME